MATITTQILENGLRNAVVQLTGVGSGAASTGIKVIDAAATTYAVSAYGHLTPPGIHLAIREIEYSLPTSQAIELAWDATTALPFLVLSGMGRYDFRRNGAFLSNPNPAGATGSILLSTINPATGAAADTSFSILFKFIKGVPQS